MWQARPGDSSGTYAPEILFLDPRKRRYPAAVTRQKGYDPLEIYLRRLGKPGARREPGWLCGIPTKVRSNRPIMEGKNFRFLQTFDPRGRDCMIQFEKPAPPALLQQMHEQLFEEIPS